MIDCFLLAYWAALNFGLPLAVSTYVETVTAIEDGCCRATAPDLTWIILPL